MNYIERDIFTLFRKKSMLDIDFEFHPVGQGLFYSGIFTHRNGNQFSMVYDCGSDSTLSYLDHQIDSFVRRLEPKDKKMLDVLFISHFHRDHINRISQLLKKTNGAKYAILPYLNEDELFLALTDYLNSDNSLDEQGDLDPNIIELLSNPISFFRERNVEKIIFIHPDNDDDKDEGFDANDDKPDDPDFSNFKFSFDLALKPNTKLTSKDSNVLHCFSNGFLMINKFWEFKLFNKPRTKVIIDAFMKDVEKLIGSNDLSPNNLVSYIRKNEKKFKKQFQDLYFKNFGVGELINQTSLIVYHSATNNDHWNRLNFYNRFSNINTGTFLNADITLDANCINDLKSKWRQYNRYFENVGVFQVPHHGSENDMDVQVFQEFTNAEIWLINFGLGNTHNHPRQKIIDMLVVNRKADQIFSNTQIKGFHYYFQYYR